MSLELTNKWGLCGLSTTGGLIVVSCILVSFTALALYGSQFEETNLIESHPAFSGLDCELMRSFISNSPEVHTHNLLIYTEICL